MSHLHELAARAHTLAAGIADSAAEAVRILREELRGLFDCVEVIARYRAHGNFGGVTVNGGRVPVGAADAGRLQAVAGRPAPFPFPAT